MYAVLSNIYQSSLDAAFPLSFSVKIQHWGLFYQYS